MSQSEDPGPSGTKRSRSTPNNAAESKVRGKDLKHLGRLDILMMRELEKDICSRLHLTYIVNDPIHGSIELHPVCVAVIDTPQFQRLRYVKQLGLCYFVYPGAAHNRFEHCVGVCFLAGKFVRKLSKDQPGLGITEIDCLCVQLAGLCHDLGHGPFSHAFDKYFIPAMLQADGSGGKHEERSAKLFEYLVEKNGLLTPTGKLREFGLGKRDITFIKELIAVDEKYDPDSQMEWPYKGRGEDKAYLYEIVANQRNCNDVDKWDYLARDCHHLGFGNTFDHDRFIKFAKVIEMDEETGKKQICIRDKEILNVYNMFFTRYTLHKYAYQHKVACALEMMVSHALIMASDHVRIPGTNGRECKLSECLDDMEAFTNLTDDILFKILNSTSVTGDMPKAKDIIRRMFTRDLYKLVKEAGPYDSDEISVLGTKDTEKLQEEIRLANCGNALQKGEFFLQIVHMDFGMKDKNPVEKLKVYSKDEPKKARGMRNNEISRILSPGIFKEYLLRIYSRDRDPSKYEVIRNAFNKWLVHKGLLTN